MAETKEFYKLPSDLGEDIETFAGDVDRFLSEDMSPAVFKAKRVPRGIYEQRKDGTYMVRIRVAGGTFNTKQAKCLTELSQTFGTGTLHVTTRQDLQLHDIKIKDTPEIMRQLMSVGLTSKGGGGNTVRNVTACPYAGICPGESFDVTPFAHAVTEYLITLQGSYNLPRKYKIAFSGCGTDCALASFCDLGFIAKVRNGKPGFKVMAGGGMGASSRTADVLEEWVPATDVILFSEAIRRLFDKMGDRENRNRARLRFVFEKIGVDKFRTHFHEELKSLQDSDVPSCEIAPELNDNPENDFNPSKSTTIDKVFKQKQDGYISMPLHIPMGFISAENLLKLAEAAEEFSEENGLRTTRNQNLIIRYVSEDKAADLAKKLKALEVDVLTANPLECFTACAGASTCRLGLCLARSAAKNSASELEKANLDPELMKNVQINISGCPNSCGQHPASPIGFFGVAQREESHLYPAYKVMLGAQPGETNPRMSELVGTVPARNLPKFLTELLQDFQDNRSDDEDFSSFFKTKGLEYFESITKHHSNIPSYTEEPDFYKDWDKDEDFSLAGRGAGECGAGVFEVIRDDIKEAKSADKPYDIFLPGVRALLITRGVDSQNPEEIIKSFEKHFIDTGLVGSDFKPLLSCGLGYLQGWDAAFENKDEDIKRLLDRIELLFSTLDANLVFHPPEQETSKKPESGPAEPEKTEGITEVDLRGVKCPMNFVKAKLKLETIETGGLLSVLLDEGAPIENVPVSFKNEGQEITEIKDLGNGHWQIVIKRKK